MEHPESLSKEELVELVDEIQSILWFDPEGNPWPDKEWSADTIELVSGVLCRYGLGPKEGE